MKDDWSNAPEWAAYRATDASGDTYWHELRPVWAPDVGEWFSEGEVAECCKFEDSLERRP